MKPNLTSNVLTRTAFLRTLVLGMGIPTLSALGAEPPRRVPTLETEPVPDLANLRTFVELARSDIRTQKATIIAENISFTDDEAVEFWPLHREYELAWSKLQDQRGALIRRFASQYQSMSDSDAIKLANDVFDLESKRTSLKRQYFKKFSKVVPSLKAARFFQIENQLNMVLDLQIAAALPLIK